ncbi:hypothetical protein DH2020_000857 [Rehmannia glutinosa]|uniref:Tetratricopeptide repeat protein 38 n=1 Tax=Rehmannia glutinosa TaxID=99300 RepID=A0ABR0XY32_REHGL
MEAETEMKLDRWGYEVRTCSDACISAINSYYHQVLSYGRNRSVILEAPESDPECVLGNILAAHFLCSAGSSRASQLINAATSCLERASSYEKAVFEALIYLISPDRDDVLAVELHSKLLQDFPRDLVSLKRAQVLCFYMGRADLSLKLVEQVLPINVHEDYIYGMLAFPLLELGRMEDAETAGKKGYEINKDDPWSQHALCHVYQYECRFKEAVEFMNNCARSWGSLSSFMYTHNWWHVALCYLEAHAPMEKVRDIYDKCIWKELMPCRQRSIIVAFSYNSLLQYAAKFILSNYVLRIQLAEALYKYGTGDNEVALELLGHDFDAINYKIIGASDEQLDVFTELHIILLLNTGEADRAILAIEKQLKKREGAPFLWRLLEKGYSMLGREEAMSCGEKARKLEATYFN